MAKKPRKKKKVAILPYMVMNDNNDNICSREKRPKQWTKSLEMAKEHKPTETKTATWQQKFLQSTTCPPTA